MGRVSARKTLAKWLEPHLPGYKVIPNSRNVDVPDSPFVQISVQQFTPPAEAKGFYGVEFVVTVVTPHTTPVRAEDDLDDLIADLLRAIDAPGSPFGWTHAQKVTYSERHLAYDVTVIGLTPTE